MYDGVLCQQMSVCPTCMQMQGRGALKMLVSSISFSPHPYPLAAKVNTIFDIIQLTHLSDQEDDAMNRWKASLGLATGNTISDPNDPRLCIIKSLALVSAYCSI